MQTNSVRLLTRTTRSVAPTEAGERLFESLAPRFEDIDVELAEVIGLRHKPQGIIRITATDYTANTANLREHWHWWSMRCA